MTQQIDTISANWGNAKVGGVVTENQVIDANSTTRYNWNYDITDERIRKLYERGKSSQWNAATYLDWSTDVDLEKELFTPDPAVVEEPWYKKMTKQEQNRLLIEANTQTLCQFLHGEQGALIATSQLVSAVPDADAKFYAATQVVDEARHVEVFSRYVKEKTPGGYDITESLFSILHDITAESR